MYPGIAIRTKKCLISSEVNLKCSFWVKDKAKGWWCGGEVSRPSGAGYFKCPVSRFLEWL